MGACFSIENYRKLNKKKSVRDPLHPGAPSLPVGGVPHPCGVVPSSKPSCVVRVRVGVTMGITAKEVLRPQSASNSESLSPLPNSRLSLTPSPGNRVFFEP